MASLDKQQMRVIGHSIAFEALKRLPKWTKSPLHAMQREIATNKTANEAKREAKNRDARSGFDEGVVEAYNQWRTGIPSKIFTKDFKVNEQLREAGIKGRYDGATGKFIKDD